MKNASVAVARIRKKLLNSSMSDLKWDAHSLWSNIESDMEMLSGSELSSVAFSMQVLSQKLPAEFQENRKNLFVNLTKISSKKAQEMSIDDVSKFLLAYGFLVREFRRTLTTPVDHSRTVELLMSQLLVNTIESRNIMRIVKGIHMCRIPVSDNLIELFNRVDINTLRSMDEKVFVVRSMIDYGLFDEVKLAQILRGEDVARLSPTSAASLLYTCAMSSFGADEFKEPLMQVFHKSDIGQSNMKSLVPLWSLEILGLLGPEVIALPNVRSLVESGLLSPDIRDVEMASTINGQEWGQVRYALKQSTKQGKITSELETQYGPLVHEYAIGSRLVVDAASVDKKIAFEIDGPSHYIINTQTGKKVLNGPSNHKQRRLEKIGWNVIRVSV